MIDLQNNAIGSITRRFLELIQSIPLPNMTVSAATRVVSSCMLELSIRVVSDEYPNQLQREFCLNFGGQVPKIVIYRIY